MVRRCCPLTTARIAYFEYLVADTFFPLLAETEDGEKRRMATFWYKQRRVDRGPYVPNVDYHYARATIDSLKD